MTASATKGGASASPKLAAMDWLCLAAFLAPVAIGMIAGVFNG